MHKLPSTCEHELYFFHTIIQHQTSASCSKGLIRKQSHILGYVLRIRHHRRFGSNSSTRPKNISIVQIQNNLAIYSNHIIGLQDEQQSVENITTLNNSDPIAYINIQNGHNRPSQTLSFECVLLTTSNSQTDLIGSKDKAIPQHTYGGAGGREGIAPTHSQHRCGRQHRRLSSSRRWAKDMRI
jgi:hypothetical protein